MAVPSGSDSPPGSPAISDEITTTYEGGDTLLPPSQMNDSFQPQEKSEGESANSSFDSREPTPDPNIIDWEPEDRQNPKNWPLSRKWIMASIVSVNTLMTALGSTISTPGVPQLMKEFHSDNDLLESFVISVYALGFAFGPLVIAPLSETYGRLPMCLTCNLSFLIWCIACAVAPNMAALVIFRFLAGAFGVAPFTLGGGTIAYIMDPAQRGTAMGIWMGGLTVGLVIGPTIEMSFKSVIVCLLCIYVAIVYTIMFILFTTFTTVFEGQYGIPTSTSGLVYLGWVIGSIIGKATYTTVSNRFVARSIAKGTFKPEDRLPLMVPGGLLLPRGLIWYGWSAQAEVHWIVPIIGTAVAAIGLTIVFAAPLAYLIDVFTIYAASAIGATVVLRSLCAAVIPLCGQNLYDKLGIGWGNTLLALIVL
ncbi:multidrug resistance protein [Penicillium malachiteum]|uniref:Multidrug resistance protein n=1 Tax=Penicillium malachiteum TaxID=1324776 RepID=A0AAD6HG02_9EURO|nr:multidrug resistance protein [Penicillium malachiteum]